MKGGLPSNDWSEDSFWADALEEFQSMRRRGVSRLSFDLEKLEAAFYDPPIYKHVDAILQAERDAGEDGRRYVPRLMMALFVRLYELAGAGDER